MSSDNYNLVIEREDGMWAAWQNLSASDEGDIREYDYLFQTFDEAYFWADKHYAEYGTRVDRLLWERGGKQVSDTEKDYVVRGTSTVMGEFQYAAFMAEVAALRAERDQLQKALDELEGHVRGARGAQELALIQQEWPTRRAALTQPQEASERSTIEGSRYKDGAPQEGDR